jgi:hypothetical protein
MRWNQQRSTGSPRFSHILVRFADNPAARQGPKCLALAFFAIDWSRFLAGVVNSHLTGAMATDLASQATENTDQTKDTLGVARAFVG